MIAVWQVETSVIFRETGFARITWRRNHAISSRKGAKAQSEECNSVRPTLGFFLGAFAPLRELFACVIVQGRRNSATEGSPPTMKHQDRSSKSPVIPAVISVIFDKVSPVYTRY
jgi:hypothetical protein